MKKHFCFITVLFLSICTLHGQTKQNIQFGTFEFHAKYSSDADWWRIQINPDSSFIFEGINYKTYDSTGTKIIDNTAIVSFSDKGLWKYKDEHLIFYNVKNAEKDTTATFSFLQNSEWALKKDQICTDKTFRKKICFTEIK